MQVCFEMKSIAVAAANGNETLVAPIAADIVSDINWQTGETEDTLGGNERCRMWLVGYCGEATHYFRYGTIKPQAYPVPSETEGPRK